jgi:hypothetical protein
MRLGKFFPVFIFFILINASQITAQSQETEKPFIIGIGLGYSFTGYREETDLPLNRYMNAINFNLNGNIIKNNFLYSFSFGFLTGEIKPVEIKSDDNLFTNYQRESTFLRLYSENALDCRLWGNHAFPGYLGGALRADVYFSVLQQSNYYSLTALLSLNVHVTQKWIISEGKEFVFSMSLPVFGYAFRPPYFGLLYSPFDLEQKIISLHNYKAVFGGLKYHHQIGGLFSFYLGLGFELSHITFPQSRKDALFSLNTGIAFSF